MEARLPIIASAISSTIFMSSMLPMLLKAFRSKDVRSYSLSHIVLNNLGNLIHSVYIFSLPPGPIWVLHIFYLLSSLSMLYAWFHFRKRDGVEVQRKAPGKPRRKNTRTPATLQYNNCPAAC